jgi:WD40 repeat protein
MKKILITFLILINTLLASIITPALEIKVKGNAQDIILEKDDLIIATDAGKVFRYDVKNKKFIKEISIPTIKDFMGDVIPAKIFSVDFVDGRYMFLSDSGVGGYSNLWIHEDNKTKQIIDPSYKGAIIKARLIDKDHALLGFLGNEASLYDLKNKKELYRFQLSPSKFSDFALNEDKTKAAYGCESGVITVIDVKKGKKIKDLKGINKDNVYKVAFKKDIITGAGQDRRGSFYDLKSGKGSYFEGNFLIYATALSPSAKRVAFAMDENNNITIYNLAKKAKIATLKGQKSTLNSIIFKDEDTIFSASDDDTVMMWKLK